MTAQQKSLNVLVIGDICEDRYIKLDCSRINPEGSDIPLGVESGETNRLGMSGAVYAALRALGINATLIGTDFSYQGTKTRYIDSKTKKVLLRIDYDTLSPQMFTFPDFSQYDAIVISDYNKGYISYQTIDYILEKHVGPVFLDTKKTDLFFYEKATIKINRSEADRAKLPIDMSNVIVTLGENGAVSNGITYWPYNPTKVVDTCGAGDAFLAGLVYGHFKDYENRIDYAIVNSGLSVENYGTQSPSEKELLEGLTKYYGQTNRNC